MLQDTTQIILLQCLLRDVLQRLDHDPVGIKVLYWGGDQMALDL